MTSDHPRLQRADASARTIEAAVAAIVGGLLTAGGLLLLGQGSAAELLGFAALILGFGGLIHAFAITLGVPRPEADRHAAREERER